MDPDAEIHWLEDLEREAAEARHWERLGLLCYPDCQVWDGDECEACPILIGRRAWMDEAGARRGRAGL